MSKDNLMRRFKDPPAALDYVVDSLIPKGIGFVINMIGPAEAITDHAATVQIVDQNKAYEDGQNGITLYLPFDPQSATHESFELFMAFSRQVAFDEFEWDGIPIFAMKFGTDVMAALHMLAELLNKVFEYPELTAFECEVYEA
jgi:hypothetical protein